MILKLNNINRYIKKLIASVCFVLFVIASGLADVPKFKKESYRIIQVIPAVEDFYCDGANLIRYPAYSIYTMEGEHVLNIPESINNPHIINILPGNYMVEVKLNGKTQTVLLEVDSASFQRFRL